MMYCGIYATVAYMQEMIDIGLLRINRILVSVFVRKNIHNRPNVLQYNIDSLSQKDNKVIFA